MKGWVYVITNPAMPGLCKVGFSTKDPELRAQEFNGTGVPYPYVVEYEVLVEDPQKHEQATHQRLEKKGKHDSKEWFRCSPEEAVLQIKEVIGSSIILETYKRLERAKAEELVKKQLQGKEKLRRQSEELAKKQKQEREKEESDKRIALRRIEEAQQQEKDRLRKENEARRQDEKKKADLKFKESEATKLVFSWILLFIVDGFLIYALFHNGVANTFSFIFLLISVMFLTLFLLFGLMKIVDK